MGDTVDGKNPAPFRMPENVLILGLKLAFRASWVVQDFFHQQYIFIYTPENNMTMENQAFEDVSPVKNCDCPLSSSFSRGQNTCFLTSQNRRLHNRPAWWFWIHKSIGVLKLEKCLGSTLPKTNGKGNGLKWWHYSKKYQWEMPGGYPPWN